MAVAANGPKTVRFDATKNLMSSFDQRLPNGWKLWPKNTSDDSPRTAPDDPRWLRELEQVSGTAAKKTRRVPIKMLVPLLIQAERRNSCWLDDFADDLVVIDADLHDVLLAYQKLQQESPDGAGEGDSLGEAA
jgi:hypothetical protein